MLCCHSLEILHHFLIRNPTFLFFTDPTNYIASPVPGLNSFTLGISSATDSPPTTFVSGSWHRCGCYAGHSAKTMLGSDSNTLLLETPAGGNIQTGAFRLQVRRAFSTSGQFREWLMGSVLMETSWCPVILLSLFYVLSLWWTFLFSPWLILLCPSQFQVPISTHIPAGMIWAMTYHSVGIGVVGSLSVEKWGKIQTIGASRWRIYGSFWYYFENFL